MISTTIVALLAALSSPAAASWQDDAKLAVVCAGCAGPHSAQFALIVKWIDGRSVVEEQIYASEAACVAAASWASRFACVRIEDTD